MTNAKHTILAINPGTRHIGMAVLKGSVLFYWSVKVIRGPLTMAKRRKIAMLIHRVISKYEPDIVVLKNIHSSRTSRHLDRLCNDVETIAAENGIQLVKYSIQEVEAFFSPQERINKTTLSELLRQRHPVLRHELFRERNSYNPYHVRMFEAVALAMMAEARADHPTEHTTPA